MQTPPNNPPPEQGSPAPRQKPPPWLYKRLGRYRLLELLGEGAVGKVFRAEDLQLARQVALKAIPLMRSKSRLHSQDQSINEARLAASLEHPNIVRVYEVGQTPQLCYIAMELVEGGNLKDLVSGSGPLDYVQACQLVAEAADALAYSHAQGIIHRDVKPANLMLGRGGRCKLADFGLAVLQQPGSDREGASGPAGTPQFVAPEVIRGEAAEPRSDLYSLAATLWYLLVGTPPFSADHPGELLEKHLNEPLPALGKLRPDLPEALVRGISSGLAKEPSGRPENMEQFARQLRVHTIVVGGSGSSVGSLGLVAGGGSRAVSMRSKIRGPLVWGGLSAVLGTGIAAAYVYWASGGWSHRVMKPASAAIMNVAAISDRSSVLAASNLITPGAIRASDAVVLTRLASAHSATQPSEEVMIEGIVTSNQVSKHGKYFRIGFEGSDEETGFACVYKPEMLPALQKKFGGTSDGVGLSGKRIRVTGKLDMYKDRPTIHIESASQIVVFP